MKNLIAFFLFAFATTAFADTGTWNWSAPTTREDATAFNMVTEGAGYHVWIDGVQIMDGADPLLIPQGTTQYVQVIPTGATVCAEFATVDNAGRVSITRSAPVCGVALAAPSAPGSVTIQITIP